MLHKPTPGVSRGDCIWRQGPCGCHGVSEVVQGGDGFPIRTKRRLTQERGWCEGREKRKWWNRSLRSQPCQHLHLLLPASRASRCTPLSFRAPVVVDTHPLVKSLKTCPFPNTASETKGSGSSCTFRASKRPRRALCSFPSASPPHPEAFWVLRVYVKGQSKPINHKTNGVGVGMRGGDTRHKSKSSETGVKNCEDLFY